MTTYLMKHNCLYIDGIEFDPEGLGKDLNDNAQTVVGWTSDKVRLAAANHICSYLFGKMQSITFSENKICFPLVEGKDQNNEK